MRDTPATKIEVSFEQTKEIPDELKANFREKFVVENVLHFPEPLDSILNANDCFSNDVWGRIFDSLFEMNTLPINGTYGRLTMKPIA